jgi:hypothetical protein
MQNKIQYRYNTKYKKKMKIPKRESEAVNRWTDITMAGQKKNDKRSNKDNVSCVLRFFKMGFETAMLITYIKEGTPAQIFLERESAMTRATFVIF